MGELEKIKAKIDMIVQALEAEEIIKTCPACGGAGVRECLLRSGVCDTCDGSTFVPSREE